MGVGKMEKCGGRLPIPGGGKLKNPKKKCSLCDFGKLKRRKGWRGLAAKEKI